MVESLRLFASVALSEVAFPFFAPRDMIHSPVYLAVPLPGRIHKAVTGVWVMFCLLHNGLFPFAFETRSCLYC